MKKRILVIEDDPAIRQGILDAVEFEGYATLWSGRGDEGLEKAVQADSDLVLLDLVLPGKDGMEVLKALREVRPKLPVIILTARGEESDRVKGLKLGADDYVVKPFGVKELLARVEAVLRRTAERPSDVREVKFPGGVADLERREARLAGGGRTELTEREAELLRYLAANSGRAVSRDELLERVWRTDPTGLETRTVDMQVARLREKLGDDPDQPRVLLTVRGKGYMLGSEGKAR
jgi:two-component system alkaline phosphatase synthesis response regulator PhoP